MDKKNQNIILAVVVVIIILMIMYWAWYKCMLFRNSRFMRKGCNPPVNGFYGAAPDPAARAEARGLMQAGWRPGPTPEHHPSPHDAHPTAIFEAHALQHAGALASEAPYYTSEGVPSTSNVLDDVDAYAAHKVTRDKAAFASTTGRYTNIRSNPAQVTAHQARYNSIRDNFTSPSDNSAMSPNDNRGYTTPARASKCYKQCVDGCGGTNCEDHCLDRC
jgi:hypothetical protein